MRGLARRRWLLSVIALGGLLFAVVSTSALALGESRGAAWCYDGNRWLGYAEGIPGSTAQEDFTACLRRSAERGELTVLRGKLLEGGTLIDTGDGTIYWEYDVRGDSLLYITAYDDKTVLFARCGNGFEFRSGALAAITSGGFCSGPGTLIGSDEKVTDPDFTLYVIGRQLVADGEDGWYHVVADRAGWSGNQNPRGELVLRNRGAAVWLSTADDRATTGQIFSIWRQLAGDDAQTQLYLVSDWQFRVTAGLIPVSFERAAHDFLLPDRTAYWTVMKDFVDAVMDDLFHGRDNRPQLDVVVHWSGLIHADQIVYQCRPEDWMLMDPWHTFTDPSDEERGCAEQSEPTISTIHSGYFFDSIYVDDLLERLAQHITGTEVSSGGGFTATLLKLWERYVPDFSHATALELADRYSVDVGVPVEVNPVSDRTTIAREVLSRMPPLLPSDYEPIDANELHLSLKLILGQPYLNVSLEDVKVATSTHKLTCSYFQGTFTINPGGAWNGLRLIAFGGPREHGLVVAGTPAKVGRVRVRLEVTDNCPGAPSHKPQFVGYSEIIVVDPEVKE